MSKIAKNRSLGQSQRRAFRRARSLARARRAKADDHLPIGAGELPEQRPSGVTLPGEGLVKLPTVLAVFPVGRSTWWAGVKEGRYPRPVRIGARSCGWRVPEIRQLIAECHRVS